MILDTKNITFTVVSATTPPLGKSILSGRTLWALYNTALPSIRVEITDVGYTVSDVAGNYKLDNIPAGRHVLKLSKNGILLREIPVTLAENETQTLEISLYLNSTEFLEVNIGHPSMIAGFRATEMTGRLAITSLANGKAITTKAGIEMDAEVQAGSKVYVVELVDWFYNGFAGLNYGVGVLIFEGGKVLRAKRAAVKLGEEVSYRLSLNNGTIYGVIKDSAGNVLINLNYPTNAEHMHIRLPATYLEYWWQPVAGKFEATGYHILEKFYDANYGWRNAESSIFYPPREISHLSGMLKLVPSKEQGYYRLSGQIIDPGMP